MKIPFNKPVIVGNELTNIAKTVLVNATTSGDGEFTRECQLWLETTLKTRKALLTHSCTAALEMAAMLCGVGPGDEVIMPSFTFVSTANAFVLRGGVPVFIDITPDTYNIDAALIEQAITPRTKAIVPVHYAGVPCDMDAITGIARAHGLRVVEDAAQALLSEHKGNALGAIGDLGCLSFHETKNIISGEGGALLINDESLIERAEILWQKGTNRKNFDRGVVDKYTWVDIGSSFLPSDLIAAFLLAQMQHAEQIIARRRAVCARYAQLLDPLKQAGHIAFEQSSAGNGHIFSILARNHDEQGRLLRHLRALEIGVVFHYIPLHSSEAGQKFGRVASSMAITDDVSSRLVRLPVFYELTDEEQQFVASSIASFYNGPRG